MTELESLKKVAHHTTQTGFSSPPARADVGNCENGVDKEFDPPVEMMVNDFDDERTLDEEEALECSEDPQTELSNLQKEGDMPLEELLAMYGYGDGVQSEVGSESSIPANGTMNVMENQDQPAQEIKKSTKVLQQLYDPMPEKEPEQSPSTSRLLTLGRNQSDEEEEDDEYCPEEEDWRKTIMVGSDYQAAIPESLCKYDDALPYENEDKLLWNPVSLSEQQVEEYLSRARNAVISSTAVGVIPTGSHSRDDEQALYLLLQCGYNIEEALRRRRINAVAPQDTMSLWSEEECRNFENGLRTYGKDFHLIQLNKVRTRSVGELVQFYYLWKKTERHDIFANKARLEKKKYTLHPGITDYMDRFLEEQESGAPRDRSSSPNVYSLIYGDPKRHRSQEESRLSTNENTDQVDKKEVGCYKVPGGATVELARKDDPSNLDKRVEIGLSNTVVTSASTSALHSIIDVDHIKESVSQ